MTSICKQMDEFFDGHTFVVQVELSNGEVVFLDDGRPGCEPASAWLRLKSYCDEQKVRIKNVFAICSNGKIPLVENAESQRLFSINRVSWFNGVSLDMFNIGVIEGDKIRVASYSKTPFFLVEWTERLVEGHEWLVI